MTEQRTDSNRVVFIDVEKDAECRYWSEKLGVSPDELRRAVREVGPNADEVTRFLSPGPGDTSPSGASHWKATSGL